jgi:preprotein translocase subunit YajC
MVYALLLFAQDAAPKGGADAAPFWVSFMPLILIMLAFVFLIVLPARRRERMQRETLFNALKKNDEVVTSSGIIGIVANIKDNEVTLKVDESSNVRMRVLKSSIIQILPKEGAKEAKNGGSETSVKAGSPPGK